MKTVLIVEDSAMTRAVIRSAVEDLDDVQTVEAATGFEALKRLPQQPLDLIITDINMPDINGLELINFVKRDPRYAEIPMLIVSTEKSEEDKRRGIQIGATAYITKPFKAEDLGRMVRDLLKL